MESAVSLQYAMHTYMWAANAGENTMQSERMLAAALLVALVLLLIAHHYYYRDDSCDACTRRTRAIVSRCGACGPRAAPCSSMQPVIEDHYSDEDLSVV
jgi:hypothetical protein